MDALLVAVVWRLVLQVQAVGFLERVAVELAPVVLVVR